MKQKQSVFLFIMLLCMAFNMKAQGKYLDKKGTILFEASQELFEPVKAKSESVTAIINTETAEIAVLALMKSFRFPNSLMEEHFNENYIESEKHPKATFRGKLQNFSLKNLEETVKEIPVEGTLIIRGKEKKVSTKLSIKKKNDTISLEGTFSVKPEDFDIKIPSIVKNKIAKEINISLQFNFRKK